MKNDVCNYLLRVTVHVCNYRGVNNGWGGVAECIHVH